MKGSFKSQAFVLKKRTLLNRNMVVDLFTQDFGHIRAIAYGVKKINSRRGPHLDTGNLIKIEAVKKGEYYYLHETNLISGFSQIKGNKEKSDCLYLFLFFLERVLPQDVPEEAIFSTFMSFLTSLSKGGGNITPIKEQYLNAILRRLGYLTTDLSSDSLMAFIEDIIGEKLPAL